MKRKVVVKNFYPLFILLFFLSILIFRIQPINAFSLFSQKPALTKNNFSLNEVVDISLNKNDPQQIEINVSNSKDETVDVEKIISDNDIKIKPPQNLRPGKYHLTLKKKGKTILEQDYFWGVLAINTNKSIYLPNENVKFDFGVLSETGQVICDAKLILTVKNESTNYSEELSTDNGKIKVGPDCQLHGFSLNPDYSAELQTKDLGKYLLHLTATTKNGDYSIDDSFEVRESVPFDISRQSVTRIYPPSLYPVTINIVANRDFSGSIKEFVPKDFIITPPKNSLAYSNIELQGDQKIITWLVDLKKGDKLQIGYYYQSPNISPQFYLLGPLTFVEVQKTISNSSSLDENIEIFSPDSFMVKRDEFGEIVEIISKTDQIFNQSSNNLITLNNQIVFQELRQWQIAADETGGPNNPSSATSSGGGTVAWSTSTNVYTSNNSRASVSLGKGVVSQYLQATGFGFTLPDNSTINGIQVDIERYASNTLIMDNSVKIIKNGTISGNEAADTATGWPSSDTYKTYGDSTDTWGLTWTASDINSSNFGLAIDVKNNKTGKDVSYTAYIDHIRITVYYIVPYTLTQNYYRWYVNSDAITVTDPWPSGDINLNENTSIGSSNSPPGKNSVLRLRTSILETGASLPADTKAFKLQYASMVGTSCGGGDETWYDVGSTDSTSATWRAYDIAGITNNSTLPSTVLSVSDVRETYVENNPSVNNPQSININQDGEWDWVVQNYNSDYEKTYCFKMVNSDGTDLNGGYNNYPQLITAPKPTISLSGTVYIDEGQTNIGSNQTVKVLLDGVSVGTTETNSSGVWNMNVSADSGNIITVYLSGETAKASAIYLADGSSHSDINLYQNKLIIHSDSGTVSEDSFDSGYGQETDQLYSLSEDVITLSSDIDLYISSGTTLDIDSKIIVDNNLQIYGSLTGDQEIDILGGNVSGNGQINLSGGKFVVQGTGNFGGSTNWTFYNLAFGDNSATNTTSKTGSNNIYTKGILTIGQNHNLKAGSSNWTFNGDFVSQLTDIKYMDTGFHQTCIVKNDGTVYCWGSNGYSQIGNNSTDSRSVPIQVLGLGGTGYLSNISQVSAGYYHTCALKNDGSAVYCWGLDTSGQCGDNDSSTTERYPTQVLGLGGTGYLSDISQVSAGYYHTCALKNDGSEVYCWGDDSSGQLGDNYIGTTLRKYPVLVNTVGGGGNLSGISYISTGSNHTCALANDNIPYCWGDNGYGQIGIGTTVDQATPAQAKGVGGTGNLSSISQISASYFNTCALKSDGSEVYCWGYNYYGSVGNNQSGNIVLTPTLVIGDFSSDANVSQIEAGITHSCALKKDNTVYCWGNNAYGELGTNDTTSYLTPIQVVGFDGVGSLTDIINISLGSDHSCALKKNGSVLYCWGDNSYGELGNNLAKSSSSPFYTIDKINPKPISYMKLVSSGGGQTCGVKNDNSAAYCWGQGNYGQLGNQSTGSFQFTPIQVIGLGGTGYLSSISQVYTGNRNTCALDDSNSKLYCWGSNEFGQIGIGTSSPQIINVPNQVDNTSLTDVSQATLGGFHICALKSDQSSYCWGYNNYGQLGIGTTENQYYPTQVKGVGGTGTAPSFSQISTGYYHTCGLENGNSAVYCWGHNNYGQLGVGNTSSQSGLVQVKNINGISGYLSNISQISSGQYFNYAVKSDNSAVYSWGRNNYGQLGIGTTENQYYPTQVLGIGGTGVLSGITQISAGYSHVCILKNDSTVYCWGNDTYGQVGTNDFYTSYPFPVQVVGAGGTGVLSGITQISAGTFYTCAYQANTGHIYCWGRGNYGSLGNNSNIDSPYPVLVSVDSFNSLDIGGTLTSETSTFEYASSLNKTKHVVAQVIESTTYNNIGVSSPSYLSLPDGNIEATNNFSINGGLFDADSKTITLGGNFTNSGYFIASNGLVNIDSSGTSVLDYSNDTTFYNLTISGVGSTVQFDQTYQTKVTNSLSFQGQSCSNKLFLNSIADGNQWDLNFTGVGTTIDYVDLHDSNAVNSLTANNSSEINNDNTNWTVKVGSCAGNNSPNNPIDLIQSKTDDTVINPGQWVNVSSIKFSVTASDPDDSDTLSLCIENKPIGVDFTNIEDSCSSGIAYSGVGVTLNYTINGIGDSSYHWQARIKDAAGAYSSWVPFSLSSTDFSIDTSSPSGGIVYDGLETNIDKAFNDGSLSVLSANWSGVDTTVSGLNYYQYSIGTSVGSTDVKNWTNNGIGTSVVVTGLTLQTSSIYYFNVQAVDNAGNTQVAITSNGQMVAPSLSFNIIPNSLNFPNLNSSNNFTVGETTTLITSTNAYGGYIIRSYLTGFLSSSNFNINNFDGGTYISPDGWLATDTGFGYHSNDTSINGQNIFNNNPCPGGNTPPCYAPFSLTPPGDIIADHTDNINGTSINNEQFTIDYKIKTNPSQPSSVYTTTAVYSLTVKY